MVNSIAKETDNEIKANVYRSIASYYLDVNADSAVYYSKLAVSAGKLQENKKTFARASMMYGYAYFVQGNFNQAIVEYNKALKLCLELKYREGINNCFSTIGVINEKQGNYEEALKQYNKNLAIEIKEKDIEGQTGTYGNIGNVYEKLGDYTLALDYQLKSLRAAETLNDVGMIDNAYNNIGNIYSKMKDYETAIKYYSLSLKLARSQKNLSSEATTLDNIGVAYCEQKKYTIANSYYRLSLTIKQDLKDAAGEAISLGNIGDVFQRMGMCDSATSYLKKALALKENLGDKEGAANTELSFANCFYKTRKYNEAVELALKSLTIGKEINSLKIQSDAHELLSRCYDELNKTGPAYENFKNFIATRDSMLNKDKTKEITQKEMQYHFEKQQAVEKADQDKKDFVVQQEKQKQKLILFAVIGGLILLIVFSVFMYNRFKITQKQKAVIEKQKQLVDESNSELEKQKKEIEIKNVNLETAYIKIEEQKNIVETHQKEIIDSINYAKRIQNALLASNELLNANLPEHFVFFQPKDIVSGDFYWASALANNQFALVTADSTGHGVPGAIMSMLNISCLKEAVKGKNLTAPGEILNYTRSQIIEHLSNDGSSSGGKDGMDCTLVSYDFSKHQLTYAAANNPVWIVRDKQILQFNADKMPVGKHDKDAISFSQTTVDFQSGDIIYTITDGFPDQFGGPRQKKFMYKPLKELLINICDQPMSRQKKILGETLYDWKKDTEQVDDILIIGVRIA
jgi:tetratricopeptide (TPR) repeat protein